MTGGFDSNVPARKPRTRIGQVLTELTSGVEPDTAETEAQSATPAPDAPNGAPVPRATVEQPVAPTAAAPAPPAGPQRAETTPRSQSISTPQAASRLAAGRERVASLRERLAQAARAPVAGAEPKRTAAAVLEVVQDLRARLEAAIRERGEVADALDETRTELERAHAELDKERKLRASIEAQAEERTRIAADAVAEAEALAAERDQVLSELTEQRRLDDEQAELLSEAEAVLQRRDEERAAAAEQRSELRAELEARAVELAELQSRLESAAADYARLEAHCRELEAEVAGLTEAREALEAIEATVNRRSG
jgi:chromosome segregation ATPase